MALSVLSIKSRIVSISSGSVFAQRESLAERVIKKRHVLIIHVARVTNAYSLMMIVFNVSVNLADWVNCVQLRTCVLTTKRYIQSLDMILLVKMNFAF